jgi:hypothetical protein
MISRDACFKILIRAFKQDRYADYFSLKWQIIEQYKKYLNDLEVHKDKQRTQGIIKQKDDKIDELIHKVDNLTETNEKQTAMITDLTTMGNQLLKYGRNADKKLDIAITKIDNLTKFITDFANTVLTTWMGSNVLKTQIDKLKKSYSGGKLSVAYEKMKFAYIVSFVDGFEMITYFCCTNFGLVPKTLKKLVDAKRHKKMRLLMPQAIHLISSEINTEKAAIKQQNFPNTASISVEYVDTFKAFKITLMSPSAADSVNTSIANYLRNERMQLYQMRMDTMQSEKTINLSDEVIDYLHKTDATFYASTTSLCQKYLNCYVITNNNQPQYKPVRSSPIIRPTANNEKLTDRVFILYQIAYLANIGDSIAIFDDMVLNGIITMENTDDLQKIADAENVDTSGLQYPDDE